MRFAKYLAGVAFSINMFIICIRCYCMGSLKPSTLPLNQETHHVEFQADRVVLTALGSPESEIFTAFLSLSLGHYHPTQKVSNNLICFSSRSPASKVLDVKYFPCSGVHLVNVAQCTLCKINLVNGVLTKSLALAVTQWIQCKLGPLSLLSIVKCIVNTHHTSAIFCFYMNKDLFSKETLILLDIC